MAITAFLLAAVVLAAFYVYIETRKKIKHPPGPVRLPFVGGYFHLLWEDWNRPEVAFMNLSKRFGSSVIRVFMGSAPMVIAHDEDTIRQMFNNPALQGRPEVYPIQIRSFYKKIGIFEGDGPEWLELKRSSLRQLRDLGFGRRSEPFEQILEEEAQNLLERITLAGGEPVPLPTIIYPSAFNVGLSVVLGLRFANDQIEKAYNFATASENLVMAVDGTGRMLGLFPFLRFIAPELTKYNQMKRAADFFEFTVKELIDENLENLDTPTRSLIQSLLKLKQNNGFYTDQVITTTCADLIFPNTSLSNVLTFTLVFLLQNPHYYKKCQEQLDAVVGRGRLPNLNDRQHLPIIEAVLREAMRMRTVTPIAVVHQATEDTKLGDFDIPNGTVVIANMRAMETDKTLFTNPDVFQPERFLDDSGNLLKRERTLPFGLGKRVCAGETFSRQNLFVFLSTIIQNFNLQPGPVEFDINKCRHGLVVAPQKDLSMRFLPRD